MSLTLNFLVEVRLRYRCYQHIPLKKNFFFNFSKSFSRNSKNSRAYLPKKKILNIKYNITLIHIKIIGNPSCILENRLYFYLIRSYANFKYDWSKRL